MKTMADDGNKMETIEIELKIDICIKKIPRILQNRAKTSNFVTISRFYAIFLQFYHDFACFFYYVTDLDRRG